MRNIHKIVYIVLILLFGAGLACAEDKGEVGHVEASGVEAGDVEAGGALDEPGTHNPYRDSGTPVNAAQAVDMAAKVRDIMVQRGDLARSWAGIKITDAKQRTFNNDKEWVVILTNPQEKDPSRTTLYIFLDPFGDVVDMNFTGQ